MNIHIYIYVLSFGIWFVYTKGMMYIHTLVYVYMYMYIYSDMCTCINIYMYMNILCTLYVYTCIAILFQSSSVSAYIFHSPTSSNHAGCISQLPKYLVIHHPADCHLPILHSAAAGCRVFISWSYRGRTFPTKGSTGSHSPANLPSRDGLGILWHR